MFIHSVTIYSLSAFVPQTIHASHVCRSKIAFVLGFK